MKLLIFIIISSFIFLKVGWNYSECGIRSAHQVLAPRIWAEQTADGAAQNPLITRFLHNKVGVYLQEISKCYFKSASAQFVFETTGVFGLVFFSYFLLKSVKLLRWRWIFVLFFLSFLPILSTNLPNSQLAQDILAYIYKAHAIAGLGFFLSEKS